MFLFQLDFAKLKPKKKKLGKQRKNKNARIGVPGRRDFRPDDYSVQHSAFLKHYRLQQPHHLTTIGPHFQQPPTSFSHSSQPPFPTETPFSQSTRAPKQFFDSEPNFSTTQIPNHKSQPFRSSPFATTPTPDILKIVSSTTPIPTLGSHPHPEPQIFRTQSPEILRTNPVSSSFEFQFSSTTPRPFVPSPTFRQPHVTSHVPNHATSQDFSEDFIPAFHHSTARPQVHLDIHDQDFLRVTHPPQVIVR